MNANERELERVAGETAIYSGLLVASGLLHLKGGNHSVRCGPGGDELIITRTGSFKKWHGTFAIGDSLAQAFHNTQAVESAARFYLDTWRLSAAFGMPEIARYVADPPWMGAR